MRRLLLVPLVLAGLAVRVPALEYPKLQPERFLAELKLPDDQGRPWRAAQEDWEGARRRVADDPGWKAWLAKERSDVEAWMAKHRDRVEWVAGWSHDGVSPKDGSRLVWNEKIPGEEVSHFASPSDPRVEITPKLKAWWVVSFRDRHVSMIVRSARLHRLTGDARFATWSAAQIDFYADNLLKWEVQRPEQGARLFWQSLTEATNLVKFTEAVRLLGTAVEPARREGWRTRFFLPEVEVLNRNFQMIHNIAVWQRGAAAQVALLFGDEALWREAIDGRFGLRRQIAEGITSDYLWHEQSLGYNGYVVRALVPLFVAAGLQGRAADLGTEMAVAQNLLLSPLTLRFPDGQLPNPADSTSIGRAPNAELFYEAYRCLPTTLGRTEAAKRRDWDTLIDPPAGAVAARALPEVTSRNLESSRMAVLRAGDWQVFFHYGQRVRSHAQAEALNYSVSHGTVDLSHDSGVAPYGSPLYRGYYTRGLNHNVPLIGGEGQEGIHPGELVEYTPTRVTAAQPKYRPGVSTRRTLELKDGRLRDTVEVDRQAPATGALGLALHLQGRIRFSATAAPDPDFARQRPPAFTHWRDVQVTTARDAIVLEVETGGVRHQVTLTAPGSFRVWRGDSPDVPPKRRQSLYLELDDAAVAQATFVTQFAPLP